MCVAAEQPKFETLDWLHQLQRLGVASMGPVAAIALTFDHLGLSAIASWEMATPVRASVTLK